MITKTAMLKNQVSLYQSELVKYHLNDKNAWNKWQRLSTLANIFNIFNVLINFAHWKITLNIIPIYAIQTFSPSNFESLTSPWVKLWLLWFEATWGVISDNTMSHYTYKPDRGDSSSPKSMISPWNLNLWAAKIYQIKNELQVYVVSMTLKLNPIQIKEGKWL